MTGKALQRPVWVKAAPDLESRVCMTNLIMMQPRRAVNPPPKRYDTCFRSENDWKMSKPKALTALVVYHAISYFEFFLFLFLLLRELQQ